MFTSKKTGESSPIYDLFYRCVKLNSSLNYAVSNLQELYKMPKDQYFSDATKSLDFIINNLRLSKSPILEKVADTYQKWQIMIANTFSLHIGFKNISNGPAEGANNLISNILDAAFGFQNFERFRKRALSLLRK